MWSQAPVFWHVKLLFHCIFRDVSKDRCALNFMVKKFKWNLALPACWRNHYDLSKRPESHTHWHIVTSQKMWIFTATSQQPRCENINNSVLFVWYSVVWASTVNVLAASQRRCMKKAIGWYTVKYLLMMNNYSILKKGEDDSWNKLREKSKSG
jgi:hypothetical protein